MNVAMGMVTRSRSRGLVAASQGGGEEPAPPRSREVAAGSAAPGWAAGGEVGKGTGAAGWGPGPRGRTRNPGRGKVEKREVNPGTHVWPHSGLSPRPGLGLGHACTPTLV
jgi:hypothetical protein